MLPRQARELEVIMGVGGSGHFSEAKVQSLSEQHVQHADPVFSHV